MNEKVNSTSTDANSGRMEAIFHEKQEGSLCAQHCLNVLLQGHYFTPVDLAEIGQQLDEQERQQMAEGGVLSEGYRNFMEQPSSNYDDSGFFSVQVIDTALRVWGLELLPFNSQNETARRAQEHPTQMKSYICNFREHWLTIRKLGNQWFNLNSLLTGPELISDTYLSLFLTQLQQEGYSIFIVIGELMECEADQLLRLCPAVQTIKPRLITEEAKASNSAASQGPQDQELRQALEQSKELIDNDDRALQKVLQLSMEGYIDETIGRIQTDQSDPAGQSLPSGSGTEAFPTHAYSPGTSTAAQTGQKPDPDEVRQKRLAFLSKSETACETAGKNQSPADTVPSNSSSTETGSSKCVEKVVDSSVIDKKTVKAGDTSDPVMNGQDELSEEDMLQQAIAMSMEGN